ncbi:LysE family translocator [Novispirillum sp. DQ9]|uniref:LysE family translocator n=1 Tax=Novispirillum sp. DQ9 TaxID=3398612 RepID=UPI003C7A11D0
MSLEMWLVFIPAVFLTNMAPGPNNLLAMNNGARFGLGRAVVAGLGRIPAFAILVGLTIIGLGALIATSEVAFSVLKWIGAAYLVYLGIRLWRDSPGPRAADAVEEVATARFPAPDASFRALATREFLVAISNPKAMLIFTAFFPQFLTPGQPAAEQLLVMGATFLVLEVAALAIYAAGGAGAGRFFSSVRGQRLLNRVSGGALVAAGVGLAAAQRN